MEHTTTDNRRTDAETKPPDGSVAQARADVYGLLAAVFDGDVETLQTALDDGTFVTLGAELPGDTAPDVLERPGFTAEKLRIGYDNLFVVPGQHYVPPFASAYVDDPSESFESDSPYHDAGQAGELFGDPAAAAAHSYATVGFEPERGDGVPDHIAAFFEFMQALCEREAVLLSRNPDSETAKKVATLRDRQRETVDRLGWLDLFHETVASEDTVEGVFAGLARFARTFVAWDAMEGIPDAD